MIFLNHEISEQDAIKVMRKYGFIIFPGELVQTNQTVDIIEDQFSSYDKNCRVEKKNCKIYTYEHLENRVGVKSRYMVLLEKKGTRYIYSVQ